MEVGIAQFRRELKDWLERAESGSEVVVTDRGRPIARLTGIATTPILDRLVAEGVLSGAPSGPRPSARPHGRVKARGDVASLVVAERDAKR